MAEEYCAELLFDLDPIIDLTKIKDNITNTRNGFSFILRPDNGLTYILRSLDESLHHSSQLALSQSAVRLEGYLLILEKAEALDEMIIGGIYTACGQTPRTPDLLGIECENGSFTKRGIYI
jgi:hypothetical protein